MMKIARVVVRLADEERQGIWASMALMILNIIDLKIIIVIIVAIIM